MSGQAVTGWMKSLRPGLIAMAMGGCLAAPPAWALPTGPQVVVGSAAFSQQTGALTVTNTPGTIINWQRFSIGANEAARFVQQGPQSSVLNRVLGPEASAILGALQSNGRVWLVNPNGILFGPSSRVDVQGLVASTLAISDRDFLAGKLAFQTGAVAGGIQNQGSIRTPRGGSVYLVAPDIENAGIVHSPAGEVLLAAGRSVSLVEAAHPDIEMMVSAPADKAVNLGRIIVESGRASLFGATLAQRGIVSASSAGTDAAGRIVFRAAKDVALEAGSVTRADGAAGGSITVQARAGTNLVSGEVSAKGAEGKGGDIRLLGERVGLAGRASVDASGAGGGGSVLVGGDYQGANAAIQNAGATYVSPEARIAADAGGNGDGGKVIVWSDQATRFYGTASARGGARGGDGGFVETSGRSLDASGARINTSAPKGANGQWLLDPNDITIQAGGSDTNVSGNPNFTTTENNAIVTTGSIQTALNSGTNVTITTGGTAGTNTQSGNITVASPIAKTAGGDATLSLTAHNDINVNAAISSTSQKLNLVFDADGATNVAANLATNGGTITATAGSGIVNFSSTAEVTLGGPLAANVVNVSGGTANFNGGLSVPDFSLSGGTASIGAAASIESMTVSGGTFSGSGDLTVSSSFTQSGGSVNMTGEVSITQASGNLTLRAMSAGAITASALEGSLTVGGSVIASDAVALDAATAVNVSRTGVDTGRVQGDWVSVRAPALNFSSNGEVMAEIVAASSVKIVADAINFDASSTGLRGRIEATNATTGFVRILPYTDGRPVEISLDTQDTADPTCAGGGTACLLLSGSELSQRIVAPQLIIGNSGLSSGTESDPTSSGIQVDDDISRGGNLIAFDTLGRLQGTGRISADTLAIRAEGAAGSFDSAGNADEPLITAVHKLVAVMIGAGSSPLSVFNDEPDDTLTIGSVTIDGTTDSGITRGGATAAAPVTITDEGTLTVSAPIDAGSGAIALTGYNIDVDALVKTSGAVALTADDRVRVRNGGDGQDGSVEGGSVTVRALELGLSSGGLVPAVITADTSARIFANRLTFTTLTGAPKFIKVTDSAGLVQIAPQTDGRAISIVSSAPSCEGCLDLELGVDDLGEASIQTAQLIIGNSGLSGSASDPKSSGIWINDDVSRPNGGIAFDTLGKVRGEGRITAETLAIRAEGAAGSFGDDGSADDPLNTSVQTLVAQMIGAGPSPLSIYNFEPEANLTIGSVSIDGTTYSGITRGGATPPLSAPVTIVDRGSLTVNGPIDAGTGEVYLGAYVDHGTVLGTTGEYASVSGSGLITGASVKIEATGHIGTLAIPLNTRTGELYLWNHGDSGEIAVVNNSGAPASLSILKAYGPAEIKIENYGALTVPGGEDGEGVNAGGEITLKAYSPLDVYGTVSTSDGNINLSAGDSADSTSNLTLHDGAEVTTGNGNINLTAGNTVSVASTATLTATGGSVTKVSLAEKEAEDGAAEDRAKKEAEDKAKKEAEDKAKKEAEDKAKKEAEDKAKKEAEDKAKQEAEEKAKQEAEAKAKQEAEEKAKQEAEEKAKQEAEEKAKQEAEAKAKQEAEEKAKQEAEAKAKQEAEAKAKQEAEEKAKQEAEAKAKQEAEEKARQEAEAKAKQEAEEKAAAAKAAAEAAEQAERDALTAQAATQAATQPTSTLSTSAVTAPPGEAGTAPTQVAAADNKQGTDEQKEDDDKKKQDIQAQPPQPGARRNDAPRNYCN